MCIYIYILCTGTRALSLSLEWFLEGGRGRKFSKPLRKKTTKKN